MVPAKGLYTKDEQFPITPYSLQGAEEFPIPSKGGVSTTSTEIELLAIGDRLSSKSAPNSEPKERKGALIWDAPLQRNYGSQQLAQAQQKNQLSNFRVNIGGG